MHDVDLRLASISRRQHGAWTRGQARAAGADDSLIARRLRSGAWLRLDTAVFASPAAPSTWERSVMAAVLAEPSAVASHRCAAVLHGLVGFRRGRPEITVPAGASSRGRLAIVHRGVDVPSTTIDHIPCVRLDHLFIDLAPIVSRKRLEEALARCADRSVGVLPAVRDRYCALAPRGGRDLRTLRAVLDGFGADDVPTQSDLERHMRRVFTRADLPEILWEAPFPGRAPGQQRVDGLVPAWRVILEGDGRAWHTRIDDFERDRRRDQAAAAAGYLTLRYSYHQITREPAACVSTLLAAGSTRIGLVA